MRKLFCLFIALITFACSVTLVYAVSETLETLPFSDEKIAHFLETIDLEIIQTEPHPRTICCFDVNSDGLLAVGYQNGNEIAVFSPEGVYLYGFRFQSSGDYSLVWNGDNISILFVRSDVIASFRSDGECVDIRKLTNNAEGSCFMKEMLYRTERTVGNITYKMESDIPIAGYARIVAYEDGESPRTMYDASRSHNLSSMIGLSLFCVFFGSVITYLVCKHRKRRVSDL